MRSISKLLVVENRPTMTKYHHALAIRPGGFYGVKVLRADNLRSNSNADGTIKGMSSNTLCRLRQAIARTRHKETDYKIYGVCFSIPWGEDKEVTQADARAIWEIFNKHAARAFARLGIGAIFRVELQERQAVHWHLIVYLPENLDGQRALKLLLRQKTPRGCMPFCVAKHKDEKTGKYKPVISTGSHKAHYAAISYLRLLWVNACDKYHTRLMMKAMPDTLPLAPVAGGGVSRIAPPSSIKSWDYCVHCFPMVDVRGGMQYLASHTAKHKQEQLGYKGKQWGYLGGASLVADKGVASSSFDSLTDPQRVRFYRTVRDWCKKYRPHSIWHKVKPRMITRGGVDFFNGLSIRNHRRLYLFGVPDSVIRQAIKGARE